MKRLLDITYTLATLLIIVGALLIFQDDVKGVFVLIAGVLLNIIYRAMTLKWRNILMFQWLDILRGISICLMLVSIVGFYQGWKDIFNFFILAVISDILLNLKDLSFVRKRS